MAIAARREWRCSDSGRRADTVRTAPVRTADLVFPLLTNSPELAPVAPGPAFWRAAEEPLLPPPPGGASRCPGAADSAESGDRRPDKSGEPPPPRHRTFLAWRAGDKRPPGPGANFCKAFFSTRSCGGGDRGKPAAERRARRDERSVAFAPVAELGGSASAAAGRLLPLAAEEGTVSSESGRRRVAAGRPAICGLCPERRLRETHCRRRASPLAGAEKPPRGGALRE